MVKSSVSPAITRLTNNLARLLEFIEPVFVAFAKLVNFLILSLGLEVEEINQRMNLLLKQRQGGKQGLMQGLKRLKKFLVNLIKIFMIRVKMHI